MDHQQDLHYIREQNYASLAMFLFDKTNLYDLGIDELIKDRKANIQRLKVESKIWDDLCHTDPDQYGHLSEQQENEAIDLGYEQHCRYEDILYAEEILLSLMESKISYAFKLVEINTKKLLRAAFSLRSTKDLSRWDVLVRFLNDRNIDAKNLAGFKEIIELKSVNNAIKHSDETNIESLKNIQEFKKSQILSLGKLELFYDRVRFSPNEFLADLITAINAELYEFNDSKIDEIAVSYALRMIREDAMKLIEKLSAIYSQE